MARTITEIQKVEKFTMKDVIISNFGGTSGIRNTIVTLKEQKPYVGAPLYNTTLYTNSATEFSIPFNTSYRSTGYFCFALDGNKSVIIQKQNTTISFYLFVSGGTPTLISSVSTLAANAEIYLEAIFCATEKAAITGYTKYVFLNLPGEAWVVAYNTRISAWQIEKVNNTYTAWASATNYTLGNRRIPTVANGYYYEVSADAGSSGGTEPTWPTTLGDTIVDSGITWICRGRYNNFPVTTSSSVKTLNGYIFVCVGGDIYNSDLDLPDSWPTSNFISTETNPDNLIALAKYKNYIVAFGTNTIEFFYDAANTNGSPLARQEGILHNIGCMGQGMVIDNEDKIFWISQTSAQTYSLWTLDKFEAKKLSTPEQDGAISIQIGVNTRVDPNRANYMYIFGFRLNGRYMVGIPNFYFDMAPSYVSNILVMDFEIESYYSWTLSDISSFYFSKPFTYLSYFCWSTFVTDSTNTSLSSLSISGYDYAIDISTLGALFPGTPRVYTKRIDCDSTNYKSFSELSINYFSLSTSNVSISVGLWRDRSFITSYNSPQNVGGTLSLAPFKITRLGRAREIYFYFDTTVEISDFTLKYIEHTN